MNLTRSAQQRMIRQLEIHVNRLSSLGDDPKSSHTLAAVHLELYLTFLPRSFHFSSWDTYELIFLGWLPHTLPRRNGDSHAVHLWNNRRGSGIKLQLSHFRSWLARSQLSRHQHLLSMLVLNKCGTFVKNMPMTQNSGRCECELACSAAD